MNELMVCS